MSDSDRQKWNRKYATKSASSSPGHDEFLEEAFKRLRSEQTDRPSTTLKVVDLACGLGQNSHWLARQGCAVVGVDISAAGLNLAENCSGSQQAVSDGSSSPNWIEADLDVWQPETSAYDLAIVFRFLDRDSMPRIVRQALKPGGWLIYETFARAQLDRRDSHISNPDFTLADNELRELFPDFEPVIERVDELADRTVVRYLGRRRMHTSD